jgi:protein phosphatase
MDFSQQIQESEAVQAEDFTTVIDQAVEVLRQEKGAIDNLAVTGKLVCLKPVGEALVIGDLHGDLTSLKTIFDKSNFIEKMEASKNATTVFLGDYGDRGGKSPELYYAVLCLLLTFPNQILLLRGNHEGPGDLMASPHDLPVQLQRKFREKWVGIYQRLRELFSYLYNAVYVEERYLMVHGGLPSKIRNLQEIANADKLHPEKTFLEEVLWNDPDEQVRGTFASFRGAGFIFGKDVTREVLTKLNVRILIRGHEPASNGFKINHEGKILTLFSRRGPPYFNRNGAYLEVPLEEKFADATQLLPYIHQF